MLQALRSKKVLTILVIIAAVVLLVVFNTSSKSQNAAPTAKATANVSSGPAPLTVKFSSNGSSDPDDDRLNFSWNFDDGSKSTNANPTKTFSKSGEYKVVLKVSDGHDHTTSASPITVKVGDAEVQGATNTTTGQTLGTSTTRANTSSSSQRFTTTTASLATKPAVALSVDKSVIVAGESATLSWTTTGTAPLCTASGAWTGSQSAQGSLAVSPTVTSTYTLTCVNGAGSDSKSVTIAVNEPEVVVLNLVNNPSFVEPYSEDTPLYWIKGAYGNNNALFVYETAGRTDDASVSITMSEYIFGDAKWIFEAVDIIGGTTYEFKDWYKSSVPTEILVDYTLSDNSHEYVLLDPIPAASDWTELTKVLVAPANAVEVSVHHMIKANGTLQVDDYSLIAQ